MSVLSTFVILWSAHPSVVHSNKGIHQASCRGRKHTGQTCDREVAFLESVKETIKPAGSSPDFYVHTRREAKRAVLGLFQIFSKTQGHSSNPSHYC